MQVKCKNSLVRKKFKYLKGLRRFGKKNVSGKILQGFIILSIIIRLEKTVHDIVT